MSPELIQELRALGILIPTPEEVERESEQWIYEERLQCLEKGYFRSPYNEEGELKF